MSMSQIKCQYLYQESKQQTAQKALKNCMLPFGDVEKAEREAVMKQQAGRHQLTSTQDVPVAGTIRPLSGSWCREARASYLSEGNPGRYRQPFKLVLPHTTMDQEIKYKDDSTARSEHPSSSIRDGVASNSSPQVSSQPSRTVLAVCRAPR